MLDLSKAREELKKTSLETIERNTATTWGGRAAASYSFCLEETDAARRMERYWEAENFRQEALEHGAMAEDMAFFQDLHAELEQHRRKARTAVGLKSTVDPLVLR